MNNHQEQAQTIRLVVNFLERHRNLPEVEELLERVNDDFVDLLEETNKRVRTEAPRRSIIRAVRQIPDSEKARIVLKRQGFIPDSELPDYKYLGKYQEFYWFLYGSRGKYHFYIATDNEFAAPPTLEISVFKGTPGKTNGIAVFEDDMEDRFEDFLNEMGLKGGYQEPRIRFINKYANETELLEDLNFMNMSD
jgi:hypothetical protein